MAFCNLSSCVSDITIIFCYMSLGDTYSSILGRVLICLISFTSFTTYFRFNTRVSLTQEAFKGSQFSICSILASIAGMSKMSSSSTAFSSKTLLEKSSWVWEVPTPAWVVWMASFTSYAYFYLTACKSYLIKSAALRTLYIWFSSAFFLSSASYTISSCTFTLSISLSFLFMSFPRLSNAVVIISYPTCLYYIRN